MKLIMQPAISLDGFIAKLDGDSETWVNLADEERYQREVERCGAVIVGHATYKQYEDGFNEYENVIVFVCTNDTHNVDTEKIKFVHGSAEEIVNHIENNYDFEELVVCGGGEINGLFASTGLIDEIVVSIQPAVLGEGIPLFGSYKPQLKLELVSTNQDIKGVAQNYYRVL